MSYHRKCGGYACGEAVTKQSLVHSSAEVAIATQPYAVKVVEEWLRKCGANVAGAICELKYSCCPTVRHTCYHPFRPYHVAETIQFENI